MHDIVAEMANIRAYGCDGARARAAENEAACAAGVAEVQRLTAIAPGLELAAALVASRSLVIDNASRIALVGCWERMASWVEAQKMVALADSAGTPDAESDQWVIADVALTTTLSERSVSNRFAVMRHVSDGLPETWEALNAGHITTGHLWVMEQVTRNLSPEHAQAVEARVLASGIAKRWTPGKLRDAARRAVLLVDPDGAADRAAKEKKRRSDVWLSPDEDMMATLSASTEAWTGRQLMDEISRRADAMRRAGDPRGLGELKVAALADALLADGSVADDATDASAASGGAGSSAGTARQPKRATALLVLSLSTMLGGDEPGELVGYGPITAELARQIAASDVRFRRLVCDPLSGKPLDLGTSSYELSEQMRRWIGARDRTCRFPSCPRRAAFCDADHAVEFPDGPTSCDNCGLLCRRHHNFKTSKAWKLRRNPDDSVDWESPHGLRWHQPAATYDVALDDVPPEPPVDLPEPGADPPDGAAVDDPDPPDPDEPLPSPPPADSDDDIDHDELNRPWSHLEHAS